MPRFELARLAADWKPATQDIDCGGAKNFTTSLRFDIQVLRLMITQNWDQAGNA